jgi:hypothetical protein
MKTFMVTMLIMLSTQISKNLSAAYPPDYSVNNLEKPGSGKFLANWIDIQLFAIRNTKIPSHHLRQTSYSAIALYESLVKGDLQYQSLAGQLNGLNSLPVLNGTQNLCWQASGNAAIADMFRYFYSDNPAAVLKIDSMEKACLTMFIAEGYNEKEIQRGSEYGKSIALAVIEWCKTDGEDKASTPYTIPRGSGLWEPTPPKFIPPINTYLGNNRTLVMASIENTQPPPPVAFSTDPNSPFYKMASEVYSTSGKLDNEKKAIALFWDDYPNGKTLTGGGHWASILKNEILSRNLSLMESARIYAEMYIAMYDASIGCFKAKYTYNLLRPVTYFQKYLNDSSWNSFIITPPHPEFPAAHAVVSRAAATILTQVIGSNTRFVDHSYDYKGYVARTYSSYMEASREAGMSRLYGGIHYLPSIEAGFRQGEKIANNVLKSLVFKK